MKKKFVTIMVLLSVPLLSALSWGKKVQLLDDSKLIDIDKAMQASPGSGSLLPTDGVTGGSDTSEGEEQSSGGGTVTDKVIEIRIQGSTLSYNGRTLTDDFAKRVEQDMGRGARFVLIDDYAEAHVYKRVRKVLRRLHDEQGLAFSERTEEG